MNKNIYLYSFCGRGFILVLGLCLSIPAHAFCGFYVGKADAKLFNNASKVILVHHEDKTVLSMQNDYQGDLKEFALVVPVPQVLKKEQIHIGDPKVFERIDAYSAPRLVEYFDPDPCAPVLYEKAMAPAPAARMSAEKKSDASLGVKVEAQYTVGEYDIVILSAEQSDGLETWLTQNGYKIPAGASRALRPYINQGMKFFVAKVNLEEQAKTGSAYLRPLQFAFDSPKFMLPLRLGMINAQGPQDLIAYVLTKNGRVESTNYRTVRLAANVDIPIYVKNEFPEFYKAAFAQQAKSEQYRVVFTEYFWNMGWCDPCAADPLSPDELRSAGVFWLGSGTEPVPMGGARRPNIWPPRPTPGGAQPVMLTRLHVRYTPETFPEDLTFQETQDQENFQARYVLRHAWQGNPNACPAARSYVDGLKQRWEQEARTLANLTGWEITDIRRKMHVEGPSSSQQKEWWKDLWRK